MRKIIISILFILTALPTFAQNVNLAKMEEEQRNAYLVNLAEELLRNLGPDYKKDCKKTSISDVRVFTDYDARNDKYKEPHVGRKYYEVQFLNDLSTKEDYLNDVSRVKIWEDNGEPMEIMFGDVGFGFFVRTYAETLKLGVKMPYRKKYVADPHKW